MFFDNFELLEEGDGDVVVNVGLGTADDEQKIAFLTQIAAKQENILKALGPDNPLCTLQQYRDTLGKIVELNGFKDSSAFFLSPDNLDPETQQKIQQRAGKQETPEDKVIALEKAKAQAEIENDRIIGFGIPQEMPLLAVMGGIDRISGLRQRSDELAVEVGIIFDNKNSHIVFSHMNVRTVRNCSRSCGGNM